MSTIVCSFDEEEDCSDLDLRTRTGREQEVLRHLAANDGRATIFWLTETQTRARASCRLESAGKIRQTSEGEYPWCHFEVRP